MGEAPQPTQIFVVSDGTGDTAASVANAAMAQFQTPWRMRRFGGIRQVSVARRIIEEAERAGALVVFTLVDEPAARGLIEEAGSRGVPIVDLLGGTIARVAEHLVNRY